MARASGSLMHPLPYCLINHRQHAEQQHPLLRFQPQITAQRRHFTDHFAGGQGSMLQRQPLLSKVSEKRR